MSLTKPTHKQRLEKAAEEPPADFEVLSGEKLLQHILEGGSLRNVKEEVSAERLADAMRQRTHRGNETEEANKNAVLQALQARRMQTAPAFAKGQKKRAIQLLSDFRAGGRAMAGGWQKATATMHEMVQLNEECWQRELLPAQPSKRFKLALARPVPGPIVLGEDGEE